MKAATPVRRAAGIDARARRIILILLTFSTLTLAVVWLRPTEPIDPEEALSDFRQLKIHLAEAWANMEWIAGHRGVDLEEADRRTTAALREVKSVREAQELLISFVRSFRDPHFYARPVEPSLIEKLIQGGGSEAPPVVEATMSGSRACKALGFRSRDLGFRLRFASQKGFEPVTSRDENPFEAGILAIPGGRRVALLRLAHFGEDGYPEVCREVWEEYRGLMEAPCTNGWCGSFRTMIRNRLLAYIEDRIRTMKQAGYEMLVVDLTGNGGGTDWVQATAQIVSPRKLACNRSSFVRHPHWQAILEQMRTDLGAELAQEDIAAPVREKLAAADGNLEALIAQTKAPCNRMPMWEGEPPEGGCTNLVVGESYTCGLFPYLEPGSLPGVGRPRLLFKAFANEYNESVNDRPVAVLIDNGTASASEDFGSILQDNGAAVIVGTRSYGAGCGFVNGGIPLVLEHVGLRVMAPDCIRFRKDGMNEIEGITPDIDLGWEGDSLKERTAKVIAALADL